MAEAIGATLGLAVGIAISPVPIAAVILMLFSARARTNSVAFAVAWVIGIAAVVSITALIPGLEPDDGDPDDAVGWVQLALGALLLVAGVLRWRSRPRSGDEVEAPGWMRAIDGLRAPAAFGLGVLLSAVNPKNLLLGAGAGTTIAGLDPSGGTLAGAVVVFIAIAAATVVVPVVAYQIAGVRLDPTLDAVKDWLLANNQAVMAVLFVVFGFDLLGDGLRVVAA